MATWLLFDKLLDVVTLVGVGEKRCHKNLQECEPSELKLIIALSGCSACIICLEPLTGVALIGLAGDEMLVEREKSPGPYWFAIALHFLIGIGAPYLLMFAA